MLNNLFHLKRIHIKTHIVNIQMIHYDKMWTQVCLTLKRRSYTLIQVKNCANKDLACCFVNTV